MPRITPAFVSLVCVFAVACGSAGESVSQEATWGGSTRDSAGVVIVDNPAGGVWEEDEVWQVVEDLRIGELGGDPDYQFGQVGAIATNSRGHILVVDRQTPTIRVFDEGGTFIREIGSPGPGPGEFARGVTDVFVTRGDTVLVPDVRNRRIHRFTPEGEFVDQVRIELGRHRPLRYYWSPATGRAVVQLRPVGRADVEDTGEAEGGVRDALRLVEPDGAFGDTLLTLPAGGLLGDGGGLTYFTPEPVWTVTDSLSVLYAVNDRYRIRTYDRDGRMRRIITRPHEPREITERDIGAFFTYLDRAWLALGIPESQLPAQRSRVAFAEVFPAFYRFFTGPEGTLWVQPVQAPGELSDERLEQYDFVEDFGAREWDVFDADGRFLGRVEMPPRFQPRLFTGDAVYGNLRDEFDVPYVARMRIERQGGQRPPPAG